MNNTKTLKNDRLRADIHPHEMADFVPKHPFKPTYGTEITSYDGLDDKSPFSDYAWAFLRRNRYYQNLIDQQYPGRANIERWGYKPSDASPAMIGLLSRKNYWEPLSTKKCPIEWEGIHTFFTSFSNFRGPARRPIDHVAFQTLQVPFVFDVDALLGPNTSAIDVQLQIARAILLRQAKINAPETDSSPTMLKEDEAASCKKKLRAMLRIADLLSPEYKETPPAVRQKDQPEPKWEIGDKKPTLKQLALKLPDSDIGRKSEQNKAVSDTVIEAYEMIYEWKLLQLLQFDRWDRHFLPEQESTPSQNTSPS